MANIHADVLNNKTFRRSTDGGREGASQGQGGHGLYLS